MPTLLESKGLSHFLDRVIANSRTELVLISSFIVVPESIITKINLATSRKVKATMIHGLRSELNDMEKARIKKMNDVRLIFHPRLHAKAYFNESEAIVSSLNLTDAAHDNRNIELGIHFTKVECPDMYRDLRNTYDVILHEATNVHHRSHTGYCIRCRIELTYDLKRPLCLECYDIWSIYSRADFKEKFCHVCGTAASTSINFPVCKKHTAELQDMHTNSL